MGNADAAEGLVTEALGPPDWILNLLFGIVIVDSVVGAVLAAGAIRGEVDGLALLLALGLFVVGAGLQLVIVGAISRALASRQRRWLEALPLSWNRDAYLRALGVAHAGAGVALSLELAKPVDDRDRELLASAATGACRGGRASWSGNRLVIHSRELETSSVGGARTHESMTYNNRAIHRWFRRVVKRFVLPTARVYEVRNVSVTVR